MTYSLLTPFKMRLSCRFFHSQLVLRSNVSRNLNINQQERLNKLVQDENYKFWLGGFIEGEGSLVISIVKNDKLKFKLALQPEFNVVQHENGILVLYAFQTLTPLFFLFTRLSWKGTVKLFEEIIKRSFIILNSPFFFQKRGIR